MEPPRESDPADAALWESTRALIAGSRRARADRDEVWAAHLGARRRVSGFGLALLGEARARLGAREAARVERARRALGDLL